MSEQNSDNTNNIIAHREYNLKLEKDEYNLRIEINQEYIFFILSKLNHPLEYTYKNKMNLLTIVNKLELNSSNYSNLEQILQIFDKLYKKNKILININDENSCDILIKLINIFEEEVTNEIKLYKEYMNNNDKFNILYNQLKLINSSTNINESNSEIESKLNDLNKKEEEIKNILNKKDILIKELNEKLLHQENEIKKIADKNINEIINTKIGELESKLIKELNNKFNSIKNNLINDINKQNEFNQLKDNKDNNKIELMEKKSSSSLENCNLKNEENTSEKENNKKGKNKNNESFIKDIELIKEEIKEINNKINNTEKEFIKIENIIKEKEIILNNVKEMGNKDNKLINQISKKIDEINNKKNEKGVIINDINNKNVKIENNIVKKLEEKIKDINNKLKDQLDDNKIKELYNNMNKNYNELREKINHYVYINKINYEFKNEPVNLRYKEDITYTNTNAGWNDMFEIFISFKDNKEYLVSPNINNYNLDIFEFLENEKILSLRGHKNDIRTVRYFFNQKDYNEYLISADDNKIVIVWDITNNYNIKQQIDTKYGNNIYSCLLFFPHNNANNYIITSTYNDSDNMDNSATKVYSLDNGRLMKYINNSNYNAIYYLLLWYNKKNNRYNIIQFSYLKILINDLMDNEIYYELIQEPETDHFSGFIFNKDNTDFLCSSSENGYINIWNLYSKQIFKVINTNKCLLAHIIQWNNQYMIVADFNNKAFIVVDLYDDDIISIINAQHTKEVKSIKKINHPIFGESLLSCSKDNIIKLWTM